jgi:hypothetical protein
MSIFDVIAGNQIYEGTRNHFKNGITLIKMKCITILFDQFSAHFASQSVDN